MANFFRSILLRLQNKSVTAGTSASTVSADSGYDGLGTVTISPTPSETKSQTAGTSDIDVTPSSGKLLSKVTISPTPTETASATPSTTAQTITPSSGKHLSSVSVSAIATETKTQAAGTSNIDVTPTSGSYLTKVTITPQQHSETYTPSANTAANDMGAVHNKRYVNTSGMIVPSGNKAITTNGTGIDVSNYSTASVSVTPSLQSKSESPNVSTNKPVTPDTGYDGLSQVTITPLSHTGYSPSSSTYTSLAMGESKSIDLGANHDKRYVRVQAAAPSGNKSITANGTGIDVASYSTVSVAVPHPTHTTTYTPAANTSNNDMGATHSYRYVNTSGMITPSGNKAISANGTGIDVASYSTVSVAVPDPTLSGDAAKANVLSGKTFYNTSTTKQTGSMTDNSSMANQTLSAGTTSFTIPQGYHPGTKTVSVTKGVAKIGTTDKTWANNGTLNLTAGQSLSVGAGVYYAGTINAPSNPTLSGDAGAGDVLSGKYFYSNSYTKQQGTISSKAAATYNTSSSDQTISSGQYLSGAQTIKAVTTSGISAANIKDGAVIKVGDANSATRIANVTGTFTDASTVSSGQTAASAAQIKSGYSAWVDGAEVKGSYIEPTKTTTGLWTNSSSTSNFAAQSVTLSQSMLNFDYLRVTFRASTSISTTYSILLEVDEFKNHSSSYPMYLPAVFQKTNSSSTAAMRRMYYETTTSIYVSGVAAVSSSSSQSAAFIIPTKIEGIKYNGIS